VSMLWSHLRDCRHPRWRPHIRSTHGHVVREQKPHPPELRACPRGGADAKPDRGPEELVRSFPANGVAPEQRASVGLQEVFKSVFPIRDFSDRAQLEFVRYELEASKYEVDECQQRGITFATPLKVTLRLVVWDVDEDTGSRSIRDIKEQDVYMGD